jgi:hypothetical protein
MTEDQARAVLLLQSLESSSTATLWTPEDRQWATRAAAQGLPDEASRAERIIERARLAAQRWAPRDAGLRRALTKRLWHPAWPLMAGALGVLLGGVSDALAAGPYFNLLSPLFWGLLLWNLAVYGWIALQPWVGNPGWLRRLAASALLRRLRGQGAGADFAARWTLASSPLTMARAAALMHALAAGLALGLVAGLLLRGLVLDYRAGWATTLLSPETVRGALAWALQPAWALAGQVPPDANTFEALRVVAGQEATASAAPWLVLMSVQLCALVVLPRLALLALALWRARRLAADFPLDVQGPAFDRWLPGDGTAVWVLPHGLAPDAATRVGLNRLVHGIWGASTPVTVADVLPWGQEDEPPAPPPGGRVLLFFDLASTPEAEVHGRLLQALPAEVALVVADAHGFLQRFGSGDRLAQRQQAWRTLLGQQPFLAVDLQAADLGAAVREARATLER